MNELRGRNLKSSILRTLELLDKGVKIKVLIFCLLQVLISFLDLLGIAFIGIITFLAMESNSNAQPNRLLTSILQQFRLESSDIATQIRILGFISVVFLVCRTFLSIAVTRNSFRFLAIHSARLSGKLAQGVLSRDGQDIRSFPSQQTSYALSIGVERATIGLIGTAIAIVADLSVTIVLSVGLLFVDFYIALFTLLYFSLVGLFLYMVTGKKAKSEAIKLSKLNISGDEIIIESITNYRDLFVRDKLKFYADKFQENRRLATGLNAQMAFIPYIGKYVIEAAIIVGAMGLGIILSYSNQGPDAISTLAVFLAASTRIAPAILRLQQGVLQLAYSSGFSEEAVKLFESINPNYSILKNVDEVHFGETFKPTIEVSDLFFNFRGDSNFKLEIQELSLRENQLIAIVGPSGSGKSTFVDLILGVLQPVAGKILVSGVPPSTAVQQFPGSIGYVPQNVVITRASLSENITLGLNPDEISETRVIESLNEAQLGDFLSSLPDGIRTEVGEWGQNLSGGQKQRLGIARALYTSPQILVLDEATSSLDSETEHLLGETINSLRTHTTVIVVAHRLATVRNADLVIYFQDGKILAKGKFEEVRQSVSNFDVQAKLMGL